MTDLASAELDKLLKQHRLFDGFHALGLQRCAAETEKAWPCLVFRLAEEVKRRRDAEGRQEKLL